MMVNILSYFKFFGALTNLPYFMNMKIQTSFVDIIKLCIDILIDFR